MCREHESVVVVCPPGLPCRRSRGGRQCGLSAWTCIASSARWRSRRRAGCARRGGSGPGGRSSSCLRRASARMTRSRSSRRAARWRSRASSRRTWRGSWSSTRRSCARSRRRRRRPTGSTRGGWRSCWPRASWPRSGARTSRPGRCGAWSRGGRSWCDSAAGPRTRSRPRCSATCSIGPASTTSPARGAGASSRALSCPTTSAKPSRAVCARSISSTRRSLRSTARWPRRRSVPARCAG